MASQLVFGDFSTNNGTDVFTLSTAGDSIYVGTDGSVGATAGGSAIRFATNTYGYIAGEVFASGYRTLVGNSGVSNVTLEIAETGRVVSSSYGAIQWGGGQNNIINRGTVTGLHNNLEAAIFLTDGGNILDNFGTITSNGYTAVSLGSIASTGSEIRNEGTISGAKALVLLAGEDRVLNLGYMRGDVYLGADGDSFLGTKGTVEGKIFGEAGNDVIRAGLGDNYVSGGDGVDTLFGNAGADDFAFLAVSNSPDMNNGRDTIRDFNRRQGDQIDLSLIDADSVTAGDQSFDLVKGSKFHREAGELLDYVASNGTHFVKGDIDGDGKADFAIRLVTKTALQDSDFIL